ncbi:serine/arginine repetitive matrix-like protein [Senna tora]|uniref:Serine/arginine repetitive matrix-like protein n=1 Tax=Senna tora TaxID=362788 RepID=A0A834XAV9_9FABA|nr:serine/arginine repetitive matrix-like protein [Senna tora]
MKLKEESRSSLSYGLPHFHPSSTFYFRSYFIAFIIIPSRKPDPEPSVGDFEFRLEDLVAMLPADELFSDGKLVEDGELHHNFS